MAGGAAAGAAAGAAIGVANANKASGAIVRVEPDQFRRILDKAETPLVVTGQGAFFKRKKLVPDLLQGNLLLHNLG